ncbi:hypothetical protein GDO81_004742 [Engystomops pustulosus]|uniref:Exophilin 5 n=1 Tax=Engystomops pustulosus TaxID=76066 RepID=A0AAV7CIA1_ENGPU|nr:hypothetical protein GDO81_004742 [Engystomops pustulosus]
MVNMSSPLPETESSRMTTSRNYQPQKNSASSFLGLRSPLSSLFSFRKSAKQILKPPPQERQSIFSVSGQISPNTEVKKKFEIYNSARSVKQIASFFEAQHNRLRENATTKSTTQLEKEVFQVLGDLDQKLTQEQSHKQTPPTSRLGSYGRQYSKDGSPHNTSEPAKTYSSLPSHDGRKTVSETHTTYATYQPRKFYEMYSNRQRPVSKPEVSHKESTSHFSSVSSTSPSPPPGCGSFSSSSLQQLSSPNINLERTRPHKSRRTPVTSIKWNNAFTSGHPEETSRPFRAESTLDLINIGNSAGQSRVIDLYKNVPSPITSEINNAQNILDNRPTGYDIKDSPGCSHEVKRPTPSDRYWEEDYKVSSFNDNEMNKTPDENLSIASDKETEPMEVDGDLPMQLNANSMETAIKCKTEVSSDQDNFNLQTEELSRKSDLIINECQNTPDHERGKNAECNIHYEVDCTSRLHTKTLCDPNTLTTSSRHIPEPDTMDIDAPYIVLHSTNTSSSTQKDQSPPQMLRPEMTLTSYHQTFDGSKKFSSFEPKISYEIEIPSPTDVKSSKISDGENTAANKPPNLYSNTSDIGGKFAWMNMSRVSSDNRSRGFPSDTWKSQKRYASSLPDVIDQDTESLANDANVTSLKKSCENFIEHDATPAPETLPSAEIVDKTCIQNMIHRPKYYDFRTCEYQQNPYTSYGSVIGGTLQNLDQKSTYPAAPYRTERVTKEPESFTVDTLKHKKRNASSLPDLLEQESDIFDHDPETMSPKNSYKHDQNNHMSSVLESNFSSIPDVSREMWSSMRYGQSCVQGGSIKPLTRSNLSTWRSLQTLSTLHYGSVSDRSALTAEQLIAEEEAINVNNKVKNWLNLTETTPFSRVRAEFKSVNFNRGQYNEQSGSDSNNNTPLLKETETYDLYNKDDGLGNGSGYIRQKRDHLEKEQVKDSKRVTISRPKLSVFSRQNVLSSTGQDMEEDEQKSERDRNLNHSLIDPIDNKVNPKLKEYKEPPIARDSPRFPVSQTTMKTSEGNLSKDASLPTMENRSTNLLRRHVLMTPAPYKGNVRVSVIPESEWKHSTSFEDGRAPASPEKSEKMNNLESENKVSQEGLQLPKAYPFQQIIENTEIYETLTDASHPEIDKIEYRKVVSIYYSLPRKFSRRISDLSKHNLKNIDKTLEQNKAPSAFLDRISRCHEGAPDYNDQNLENTASFMTQTPHNENIHSIDNDDPCKRHLLNFHIIPLQTNLGGTPNSEEERGDLVNKFSSLHIYENENDYTSKEDPKNKNDYSPLRSSPKSSPNNIYYTLPSRKSSFHDLERNVLERDIAMVRDRFNVYTSSRNMEPSPPDPQDVFASPAFSYDNLKYSPSYDFMHFQESNKQDYNINNNFAREGGVYKKNSLEEDLSIREDLPSIYKSKSFKDLSQRRSYNTEDISPHQEYNTSPPTDSHYPNFGKTNDVTSQRRPSYCSEFVQKKMKPINAKKFSFSSDHTSKEKVSPRHTSSYGDSVRLSDTDSPPVFYSPNDHYPSYVNKHFGQEMPKACQNDPYSNLYRSKSMKFLNTAGQEKFMDYKRKSDGSFSSKSYGGTLRSKSPSGDAWNRRGSAEILDENDNWPISKESCERKPVCTSKSLDYGIFGKEQQEAILNNVKRSLTEGRLWSPNFLKNPGFLRTEEHCSSQEINPVGRTPDDSPPPGLNVKESLNIDVDEPVDSSDTDTDTTTDDEYYLDDYYKESEL